MDLNSWRQGRAYGVLDEDIRAEQRDWWARARHLEQTLGDEPESWTPALKSSWCHSRDSLLEAGYQTIPDDLRAPDSLGFLLGSMAQGAVSARSCARGGSDEDGSST